MKSLSFSLFSSIYNSSIYTLNSFSPPFLTSNSETIHLQHRHRKMRHSSRFTLLRSYLGFRHHRRPVRFRSRSRRFRFAKDLAGDKVELEIEIENLKLYMENQSIIEENERLRKKAFLLRKENQVLQSQLQSFSEHKSQPA